MQLHSVHACPICYCWYLQCVYISEIITGCIVSQLIILCILYIHACVLASGPASTKFFNCVSSLHPSCCWIRSQSYVCVLPWLSVRGTLCIMWVQIFPSLSSQILEPRLPTSLVTTLVGWAALGEMETTMALSTLQDTLETKEVIYPESIHLKTRNSCICR